MIDQYLTRPQIYPTPAAVIVRWSYKRPILAPMQLYIRLQIPPDEKVVKEEEVTDKMFITLPFEQIGDLTARRYVVVFVLRRGTEEWRSPPYEIASFAPEGLEYMREVIYKNIEFSGLNVAIYKLKLGGKTCPVCFNEALMQPSDPNCRACLGTGFEGGYNGPYIRRAVITAVPSPGRVPNPSPTKLKGWQLMLDVSVPLLEGDLVYVPARGAWLKVGTVKEEHYLTFPVLQLAICSELEPTHPAAQHLQTPVMEETKQFLTRVRW